MGINAKIVSDEKISFNFNDEISHLKRKIFFWKKNTKDEEFYTQSERVFRKGEEMVKNECNLFSLIQTI